MSLAELNQNRGRIHGFETDSPSRWMEDFRVEEVGIGGPCVNDDEETLPPPVDSKDLFREAANLPNSDRFQINIGRFLQYLRYRDVRHHLKAVRIIKKAETERIVAEAAKLPVQIAAHELLEMLEHALQSTKSPSTEVARAEVMMALKQAIQSIQSRSMAVSQAETVLESFEGYVDSVEGDTAYVTLESREHGDVLYGEYSASELLGKGISEQSRFLCQTVKEDGATRIDFALPKLVVTDEEVRAVAEEMHGAFPSDDDSGIKY